MQKSLSVMDRDFFVSVNFVFGIIKLSVRIWYGGSPLLQIIINMVGNNKICT